MPTQANIPLSAPMQDREHTSSSVNEEIARRTEIELKTNESYICVQTSQDVIESSQYEIVGLA